MLLLKCVIEKSFYKAETEELASVSYFFVGMLKYLLNDLRKYNFNLIIFDLLKR